MDAEAASLGAGERSHPAVLDLGLAFEQATIGMAVVGADGQFLRMNRQMFALLGGQDAEELGLEVARAVRADPPQFEVEHRHQRPDGSVVELRLDVTVLHDRDGGQLGYLTQAQDVTERNAVTRKLKTNDAWLRSLIDNAPVVMSVYDLDGKCTFSAGRAFDRVGISPEERVGRSYAELRGDVAEATKDFERLLAGEVISAKREITPKSPDGQTIFDVHYGPLPGDDDGKGGEGVAGVISVAVDITDLELAERGRRQLLHQLITAQENEQRRLAGNLHDDTIQALSAARMHLSVLNAAIVRLGADADPELREAARQVLENLEHGVNAARTFLFDMRPPLLDQEGLAPALGQQLGKLGERSGCATEFDWRVEQRLDQDLEVLVFRVVQEALANVAKHASAKLVELRGRRDGSSLEVEVTDDGVGFDQAQARGRAMADGHLGLRSMDERIAAADGELRIDTAPGFGTTVHVRMPVPGWGA
jgi:PAS domain S-box-containing protein